jgi:two-component system, OmpR family, sensor kinase
MGPGFNRILFRIVPLSLAAVAVASLAIYFLIRALFGDPLEDIARKQASGPIFLLEHYIDQAPADEWLTRLNRVREISDLNMELIPLAQALSFMPQDKREALQRGELVLDLPGKAFLRRVDLKGERYVGSEEEVLQVSRLPVDIELELRMEALRFAVVALCLLFPLVWWSRAHWRELLALSRVATDLGAGKLTVRATTPRQAAVYPLAQCMNQMANQIGSLLEAQRQLMHSVSHELRTPISRIEFSLALLRDQQLDRQHNQPGGQPADPALEKRIASMEDDLRELNALVSELLGLNRLEQEPVLQKEELDLSAFLHDCAGRLEHALSGKHLSLALPAETRVIVADRRLLARAVGNLLENAAKYAESRINLRAQVEKSGETIIIVEDDGPGIPDSERDRIFEPFYRLDRSRDRASGGFGLGLAIARKAVRLHGGDIDAGTSPLGGALMRLRFQG